MTLACGVDFGTSNSTLSLWGPGGLQHVELEPGQAQSQLSPTLSWYLEQRAPTFGRAAVAGYIEQGFQGRLIQAVKRHLPSQGFQGTWIGGRIVAIEEIVAAFLRWIKRRADEQAGASVPAVLLGRPARYHDDPGRDQLAQGRMERAARLAGFEQVAFMLEPVAAARRLEVELDREVLCLVGDFGGGTSDFTLIRLSPHRERGADRQGDVLGTAGLSIAGNDIDARLMQLFVLPALGLNARWSPMGRPVPVPTALHHAITRWHTMCLAGTPQELELLDRWIRSADDAAGLRRLRCLLEDQVGFMLFQAVERAKIELCRGQDTVLRFESRGISLAETISTTQFEAAIGDEVGRIYRCAEGLLTSAGRAADEVDVVFLTGGTSLIPSLRRAFERRFPGRILEQDAFTSVGEGLGLEAGRL